MRSATYDLTISSARADALFASPLQRSDKPSPAQVDQAIAGLRSNESYKVFKDPMEACRGADLVTTDVWTSMGYEAENEMRRAAFAEWCVDEEMMREAVTLKRSFNVMHYDTMWKTDVFVMKDRPYDVESLRRADDALGETVEPRKVRHAVHALPADGLLADLLRESFSAHGKSPGGPGTELHRISSGRGRRHDDIKQRTCWRRGSALR